MANAYWDNGINAPHAQRQSIFASMFFTTVQTGYNAGGTINGPQSDTQPPTAGPGNAQAGARWETHFEQWYLRIHINPATLALGSLASSQVRTVRVWSAFFQANTLNQITQVDADGVSVLSGQMSGVFLPLKEETYQLAIAEEGAVSIEGTFTWDFVLGDEVLPVTGQRITIVPFEAENNVSEGLSWLTNVLQTYGGKQRRALRRAPRQSIRYRTYVPGDKRTRLEFMLNKQAFGYGIPLWWERQRIGNLSAGAMAIALDETETDLRVNSLLFVYESDTKFEAVEVQGINSGSVDLSRALANSYTSPEVMPMRVGYLRSNKTHRLKQDHNLAELDFLVSEYAEITGPSYTQHRGYDVLEDSSVLVSPVALSIEQARVFKDSDIGVFRPFAQEEVVRAIDVQHWVERTKARRWALRQWLYARQGRFKPFWQPTWQRDFVLAATINSADLSIDVTAVGASGAFDLMLETTSGARFYIEVLSVTDLGGGVERLAIASELGQTVTVASVQRLSLLRLVVMGSDEFELTHSKARQTVLSSPVESA